MNTSTAPADDLKTDVPAHAPIGDDRFELCLLCPGPRPME
jgi:hypothetical protein